jgi:hypothetical protein
MGAIFPEMSVAFEGNELIVSPLEDHPSSSLRREIMNLLYRERILAETQDIRKRILS